MIMKFFSRIASRWRRERALPFNPTEASRRSYQALIHQKVALIDRLPSKYLKDVKILVWESVMRGYDESFLARGLRERFGIARQRAERIARSQCKMARAIMENAHRAEIGILQVIWRYTTRCEIASHAAFNGKRFQPLYGARIDGKWIWPGSELDCWCTSAVEELPEN
jgi:uncharacterized protein with gpF-like domain